MKSLTSQFTFSGVIIFFPIDLVRQCCDRGSMHKKNEVCVWGRGGGEKVGVVQKQMCAAQTAHKVWKVQFSVAPATARPCWITKSAKGQTRTSDSKSFYSSLPRYLAYFFWFFFSPHIL